jgi:hypothetical protein
MRLHELQERRAALVAEMRSLADKAEKETRDLSDDEGKRFDALKAEIAGLDVKIQRAQALAEAERAMPAASIISGRGDGTFEERARRDFSITRAIRAALPADVGGGGVDAGLERELGQEVVRRSGRAFQGLPIPDECFMVERRTLLAGSSAADLIPNVHRADLFVDRLRARLITARLGATYLDGLVGSPIDLPRQAGSSSAQWVGEDGSLTETDASFDDINLTPKTVGAMTSYSRRTLLNASPSIEQIIRNDLAAVIASAVDEKALTGDGSSNTPTGVIFTSGVTEIAETGPDWDAVLQFVASIDASNALDNSLGWATNPWVVKKLRGTLVAASTDSRMVMTEPGNLAGYRLESTSALPGGAPDSSPPPSVLIFGDWSQLLIASWTGSTSC